MVEVEMGMVVGLVLIELTLLEGLVEVNSLA